MFKNKKEEIEKRIIENAKEELIKMTERFMEQFRAEFKKELEK